METTRKNSMQKVTQYIKYLIKMYLYSSLSHCDLADYLRMQTEKPVLLRSRTEAHFPKKYFWTHCLSLALFTPAFFIFIFLDQLDTLEP